MAMEKITKEELKNLLGGKALNDEELEMVAGGGDGKYVTECNTAGNEEMYACFLNGGSVEECAAIKEAALDACFEKLHS